jgi:magnesium transporter
MKVPFGSMVRKRATRLVVLFVGEMLTATAMGFFETEIQKAVVGDDARRLTTPLGSE